MQRYRPSSPQAMRRIAVASAALAAASLATPAGAQEADAAFNAFNASFLVQTTAKTYYAQTIASLNQGTKPQGLWGGALDIAVAEDDYERTFSSTTRSLVSALLDGFVTINGANWSYDGWNDDLGWMINPFVRGYQITGNASYLTIAETNWNTAYNRGWDTTVGGGIWENSDHYSKCALSNDNFVFEAVALYQITGDASYLSKAEGIYAWVRQALYNSTGARTALGAPGQVNGCISSTGKLEGSDNVYDSGTFAKAANDLYRVTGNASYYYDALVTVNHITSEGPILHNRSEGCGCQWGYWFTLALSQFATDAGFWPNYGPWMQANADAAWNERNSLNLTWNDWTSPTNDTSPAADSLEMSSAAAIWQHLPPASLGLTGRYEIVNAASQLALNVDGNSTSNGAAVIQWPYQGTANELWTFVPTSGGYYQIKSASSGLVLNVAGASSANGAAIVQWPAQGMIPGNDQWKPVQNYDGTYSFYNLNSHQALDDPAASTTAGAKYQQAFGNGTAAQEFALVQR